VQWGTSSTSAPIFLDSCNLAAGVVLRTTGTITGPLSGATTTINLSADRAQSSLFLVSSLSSWAGTLAFAGTGTFTWSTAPGITGTSVAPAYLACNTQRYGASVPLPSSVLVVIHFVDLLVLFRPVLCADRRRLIATLNIGANHLRGGTARVLSGKTLTVNGTAIGGAWTIDGTLRLPSTTLVEGGTIDGTGMSR
jgi:hypothetical protein